MLYININMSPSNTHYSDSSTGLKVEILQGPINYTRWLRDFKLVARGKRAWSLIAPSSIVEARREAILTEPVRPTKPDSSHAKYTTRGATTEGESEAAAKREILRMDRNNYQLDMMEYMLDLEAFEKQQERLDSARLLLFATVTPALLMSVRDTDVPSELMAKLESLRKGSDIRNITAG